MNSDELVDGANEGGIEEIVTNSKGDSLIAQKDQEIEDLKQKISILEAQRNELHSLVEEQASNMMSSIESREESKQRAVETESKLEEALQKLAEANSNVENLEEELRMLRSVAGRAAELETQVVRLQHDFISVMTERDAILAELEDTNNSLEDTRKAMDSKDSIIKNLETQRDSLKERMEEQTLKLDSFAKQLEDNLSDANLKLTAEKWKLEEAEKTLVGLVKQSELQEKKIKEREKLLNQRELENARIAQADKEKEALIAELSGKLNAAEAECKQLIEKLGSCENGDSEEIPSPEMACKIPWPMAAAASTGTLAAAAFMAYLKYGRRR